ncbi:hypothetical protein T484DRAFT_1844385 [Baffinella frigidus]|nr:hypothetical protein T484DRAFT_1844385 [Cryptophyta sp. CCMP2293]
MAADTARKALSLAVTFSVLSSACSLSAGVLEVADRTFKTEAVRRDQCGWGRCPDEAAVLRSAFDECNRALNATRAALAASEERGELLAARLSLQNRDSDLDTNVAAALNALSTLPNS